MPDISVPLENKKDKIRIKKELTKKKGGKCNDFADSNEYLYYVQET